MTELPLMAHSSLIWSIRHIHFLCCSLLQDISTDQNGVKIFVLGDAKKVSQLPALVLFAQQHCFCVVVVVVGSVAAVSCCAVNECCFA